MKELSQIRQEIDAIDTQIVELFKKRMDCAKDVALYKQVNGIPVLNTERERAVLDKVSRMAGEYSNFTKLMYTNIMELSRALQHNMLRSGKGIRDMISQCSREIPLENIKIGHQGIRGANSFEAAEQLFPMCELKSFDSFRDVFDAVDRGEINFGVLPVENSTAGSVSDVYDLILEHRFYIIKAADLPIRHCLCSLRQAEKEDIETVISHPQALAQCAGYISSHGYESYPVSNTAIAARNVFKEKRLNMAAICSKRAAKEYSLKIIDDDLQDDRFNTTRFIVISKKLYITEDANKVSLCFSLPHVSGSLYNLLCRFNSFGLNLTKIESRPMKGKDFDYLFYLDFSGNITNSDSMNLICQLSEELPEFSFLGNYCETDISPKPDI